MRKHERMELSFPTMFGRRKAVLPLFACLLACSPAGVYAYGQDNVTASVSITKKNISAKEALEQIKRQTGVFLMYREEAVKGLMLDLDLEGATLTEALDCLCEQTGLTYELSDGHVLIRPREEGQAVQQERQITLRGTVVDSQGSPLMGATIRNPMGGGKNQAVIADMDGNFSITVPAGVKELEVAFIGMRTQVVAVKEGQPVRVVLEEDKQQLDEVIVTGYQTLSKERATGSFTTVNTEELHRKLDVSLQDRLEGAVAGLTDYHGFQIRGVSTLAGTTTPLYVVDGVPFEGSIAAINPAEIVNVTVLKDAAAASIYGARAANGVIVITTRGGEAGKVKINYNGSVKFTPLYDVDYKNLMSSSELVDFQKKLFNIDPGPVSPSTYYMNEVRALLFANKDGKISDEELERQLDVYRHRDRYSQAVDKYIRKPAITQQHNISLTGGSEKYTYALSLNYMKELPYDKFSSNDRIGLNFKNTFKFNKWISADLRIMGSFFRDDNKNNAQSGVAYLAGGSVPSYMTFYDEQGNEIPWYTQSFKSKEEIDRLVNEGLYDETYYPLQEIGRERKKQRDDYWNINANIKFTVNKDLYFNVIYSQDLNNTYTRTLTDEDAHSVRKMVNDAAQIDKDGNIIYNIPTGGQIKELRGDRDNYTLRVQGNFDKLFGEKHRVTVLAGAERRATKSRNTSMTKVGWDDEMMVYKKVDEMKLSSTIKDTEALSGQFTWSSGDSFTFSEDRYVSFYANASYTFDERATVTGSMRIDQSNLFGSDPKYQYRPLWSVGGQYLLLSNKSWVDRLSLRLTYGINGNIPKNNGPYMTIATGGINDYINDYQNKIASPENPGLRWEKTNVFNVGIDFNLFRNRLNGSVEFYNKATSDLLHERIMDPTLGWREGLKINYGEMYNRGVEVSLSSVNFRTKDFSWTTNFNFSYNKNKVTRLDSDGSDVVDYIGSAQIREGLPRQSLYSVRWAGLDGEGNPQAYKKDGTIVKSISDLEVEDLVYSGTINPPYAAAMTNSFQYKNLSCSILFTYYGGHDMRGVYGQYITGTGLSTNQDRLTGNFWEKPGDENDPSKAPRPLTGINDNMQKLWQAADKHMQPGDFIKLNQINLAYSLPTHLLAKTPIESVSVTLQIDNVWKWVANDQDLDPEVWAGGGLTASRGQKNPATYSLGLSCTF